MDEINQIKPVRKKNKLKQRKSCQGINQEQRTDNQNPSRLPFSPLPKNNNNSKKEKQNIYIKKADPQQALYPDGRRWLSSPGMIHSETLLARQTGPRRAHAERSLRHSRAGKMS